MLNKVFLIGRLGGDPEMKYLPSGTGIASFSVATDESYKKDGERVEKTEWHRVTAFGKLAEICGTYLTKGKLIYIEGKIQTDSWEDDSGNKRLATKIIASNMKMLDGKGEKKEEAHQAPVPSFLNEDDDVPF